MSGIVECVKALRVCAEFREAGVGFCAQGEPRASQHRESHYMVVSVWGMEGKSGIFIACSLPRNVKCEASNFINFHFGKTVDGGGGVFSFFLLNSQRTFIYPILFLYLPFQPFFTLESHTTEAEGLFRHSARAYYAKRSCKGAFYGQLFYFAFSFVVLFFIQLVSHHTTCTNNERNDMKWLQFHLIATQTAQNHITFICYSISPDDERRQTKNRYNVPTLNN